MAATPIRILALGDSLTAGYNLPPDDAFPVKLQAALRSRGYPVEIINAGVSGDTSAGGRARLDWTLGDKPDYAPNYAIVELGANDALRGVDPELTYANLDAILGKLQARNIKVVLAGMLAPRNMGADYTRAFDNIYPRLRAKYGVAFYAFFLDGVALHPELTLPDGLHPNAKGVDRIVDGILPVMVNLLGPQPAIANTHSGSPP